MIHRSSAFQLVLSLCRVLAVVPFLFCCADAFATNQTSYVSDCGGSAGSSATYQVFTAIGQGGPVGFGYTASRLYLNHSGFLHSFQLASGSRLDSDNDGVGDWEELSGTVFEPNEKNMRAWTEWWKYLWVDQGILFGVGCVVGMYLCVVLAYGVIPAGTDIGGLAAGAYQADYLVKRILTCLFPIFWN